MAGFAGITQFLVDVTQLSSFPVFCAYLLMVLFCGVYCKLTRPLQLRPILVVYNFSCTILSAYTVLGFLSGVYDAQAIYLKSPTKKLEHVFYVYWLTKNIELMDTVFMILRHKTRQVSFLHIYHHSSMVILSDYSRLYAAWPAIAVVLCLNSFVHVVLYLYYGLSALNPDNPPTWKKRLTELQIIQFVIDMVYGAVGYWYHGFCVYGQFYGLMMTYLFCSFYYKAYLKPKSSKTVKSKSS